LQRARFLVPVDRHAVVMPDEVAAAEDAHETPTDRTPPARAGGCVRRFPRSVFFIPDRPDEDGIDRRRPSLLGSDPYADCVDFLRDGTGEAISGDEEEALSDFELEWPEMVVHPELYLGLFESESEREALSEVVDDFVELEVDARMDGAERIEAGMTALSNLESQRRAYVGAKEEEEATSALWAVDVNAVLGDALEEEVDWTIVYDEKASEVLDDFVQGCVRKRAVMKEEAAMEAVLIKRQAAHVLEVVEQYGGPVPGWCDPPKPRTDGDFASLWSEIDRSGLRALDRHWHVPMQPPRPSPRNPQQRMRQDRPDRRVYRRPDPRQYPHPGRRPYPRNGRAEPLPRRPIRPWDTRADPPDPRGHWGPARSRIAPEVP
jgi:hypothetical protein